MFHKIHLHFVDTIRDETRRIKALVGEQLFSPLEDQKKLQ
ncbi:hypothetical protein GCM10007108_16210 [Thermogymnomonas acidicola]|uniref:Uncharacterized protein n=1 Tax=Thermogymnomonas acidicola TaxID=399579 RepID=A0AA37BSG8_9ARCH|nr:hypothetical protein GCM10007108_16210 [Thermogymnomonas acidicola]